MKRYRKVEVGKCECGNKIYRVQDLTTGQYVTHNCTHAEALKLIDLLERLT